MTSMAREPHSLPGAYVHVPFCRRKCAYCSFYSAALTPERVAPLLDALEKDLARRASPGVQTLYVGGGTPASLSAGDLEHLLAIITNSFPNPREFTIEANPGSVDASKAGIIRRAGVSRVSLGVQSCSSVLRAAIGRQDAGGDWRRAVLFLTEAGFEPTALSADLIYGIRGQSVDDVEADVTEISEAGFGHVSLYALSVEPGSRLSRQREPAAASEQQYGVLYRAAAKRLSQAGFERYEISGFARNGCSCRHNINYWKGGEWQAFGPSAVGQEGGRRYRIPPDRLLYAERMERGLPPFECEDLTEEERLREKVMLGLRLDEGLDTGLFGGPVRDSLLAVAGPFVEQGLLVRDGERFSVPVEHAMVLDEITAELLAAL